MRFAKNDKRTRLLARSGGERNAIRCYHLDEDLAWKLRIARRNEILPENIAKQMDDMNFPDYALLPTCKEIRAIIRRAEREYKCSFTDAEEYLIKFRKEGYKND